MGSNYRRAKSEDLDDFGKARMYELYEQHSGVSIIDYVAENVEAIPYTELDEFSEYKDNRVSFWTSLFRRINICKFLPR